MPRIALTLASVAIVVGLGELAASSVGSRAAFRGLHAVRADSSWLYDLEPGAEAQDGAGVTYHINANGFRDAERTIAKPAGVFRVAVLGDSVAFGYGVEREAGFTAQTEAILASGSQRVEVLNFAVSGYNPYNEVELYRGVVRAYAPDLVLVQFCVNDLNDPTLHFGASTMKRLGDLPALAFPNPEAARRERRHPSALVLACERSALCTLAFGSWVAKTRGPQDSDDWRTGFEIREGAAFAAEWTWLRARYADLAQSARADGAGFGILAFPYEAELNSDAASGDNATARLSALGRDEDWKVINLLPAFQRANAPMTASAAAGGEETGERLFLDVWHPTSRGHGVAAGEIARALRCRSLVPGEREPDCG